MSNLSWRSFGKDMIYWFLNEVAVFLVTSGTFVLLSIEVCVQNLLHVASLQWDMRGFL